MQSRARPIESSQLHPARHEFKRKSTQLNLNPTGARNQRKFAPNPSPIRIRIPACISVSIFGITFWLRPPIEAIQVGLESKLKGPQLCSLPKVQILKLNKPKMSVK